MKIRITYTYTPELTRAIYVERAEQRLSAQIEVEDRQLSPRARQAALDAIAVNSYESRLALGPLAESDGYYSASNVHRIFADWPDPVATEPDAAQAATDAETLLVQAAEAAPLVRESKERLIAAREAARAELEERQTAWVAALDPAVLCWVDDDGVWRVGTASIDGAPLRADRDGSGEGWKNNRPAYKAIRARAEEICAEKNAMRDRAAEERAQAVTQWIREHAPDLLPRHTEGVLPERELLERVRDVIFAPFEGCARYQRIVAADIAHTDECTHEEPTFTADDADALSAVEYDTLRELRARAKGSARLVARKHIGYCKTCTSAGDCVRDAVRLSALVTIAWCDREVSREFAL